MRKRMLFGGAIAVVIVCAAGADAQPLPGAAASARKEVREAREEAREARKDAREAVKDAGREAAAAAIENLKKAQDKLRETRIDRRKTHIETVKSKWKTLIGSADARQAIRVHARREARLHRMKALATELGKTETATRIDALITKEQARFDKKMEEIRTKEAKQ